MSEKKTKIKIAPHSKESEMMVLGCMLTSTDSLNVAADALEEYDFYFTEHKILFLVLKNAYKKDKPADIHLVCEELKRIEKLEAVGGASYVATLAQYVGTSAYIEEYVEVVKSKSILRKMIYAAETVQKNALDEPEDVYSTLDDAQNLFFKISQAANPGAGILISDLLNGIKSPPILKTLQERQEHFRLKGPQDAAITGIPTHFIDLDRIINGLNNSHLIILAARPAMGKTAFALNIAEQVCFKNNLPVGIFSLEMTAEQLLYRIITSQAEVESDKIKTGALNGVDFQRIVSAVGHMQKHMMVIDDQPGLKITDIRARARRMKEAYGIRLLVIDYLQLITGSNNNRNFDNRQNEISEISRMLKTLARELDIPVICLSQLSRKVEDRTGHRPLMSDLRESGCLTGDTIIEDAETGILYRMKELAERKKQVPISVYALDSDLKLKKEKMIKVFYSGKKVIYKLTTKSGRTIKASANHPFFKLEGWTRLDELKIKDRIAIARHLPTDSSASSLKEEELTLLAHLLGDGCILPNQPYHYTSQDETNISLVRKTSAKLFNINARLVKQKNWFHLYLPSPKKLSRKKVHPITSWFENLAIERVRSYDKKIPESVFACNKRKVALFLHHLWGTDGNISQIKSKDRKPSLSIYYSSTSHTLSHQVQHLLLRLGIQSTLRKIPSKTRPVYTVNIQGANQQIAFLNTVGSSGQRGVRSQEFVEQLSTVIQNPNLDVIPKEAWKLFVLPAKEKLQMSWRQFSQHLNVSYSGTSLFKRGISRHRMQLINDILKNEQLSCFAESDIYWDEIMSIEKMGEEDVYDATVENLHNFVANDFIVHNSIEQDSDIVMFLLRREYYDPNDKPGMAEVIIAKNRHGGIGNVNLTFVKEFAQFRNYSPAEVIMDEENSFASL